MFNESIFKWVLVGLVGFCGISFANSSKKPTTVTGQLALIQKKVAQISSQYSKKDKIPDETARELFTLKMKILQKDLASVQQLMTSRSKYNKTRTHQIRAYRCFVKGTWYHDIDEVIDSYGLCWGTDRTLTEAKAKAICQKWSKRNSCRNVNCKSVNVTSIRKCESGALEDFARGR